MAHVTGDGYWEFRLFKQIVVCPNCEAKNRLAHNRPRPACGRCQWALDDAKVQAPSVFRAARFEPSTRDGELVLESLRDGHRLFARGVFDEASRMYQAAIQAAFSGQIPERDNLEGLVGEAQFHLGMSLYFEGVYTEALRAFRGAVKPLRFFSELYLWILAALERSGQRLNEAPFLTKLLAHEVPPSVRTALAPRYKPMGKAEDPAEVTRFCQEFFKGDPELLAAVSATLASQRA